MVGLKTANVYSLLITLVVVLLVAAALLLYELTVLRQSIIEYVLLGAVVSVGIFLTVRFFFIRFVAGKIDPIFNTIHSYTMSQKKLKDKINKEDVITDLNQEVKVWADNQSQEIKKLRQLEKYRKDFLGNVSHELKTPIFNIQGYILTLLDGA